MRTPDQYIITRIFIIFICSYCITLHAEDAAIDTAPTTVSTTEPVAESSLLNRWLHSFEDVRDKTSENYINMSRHIDSYFSGKPYEENYNGSTLLLDLKNTRYKNGEQANDIAIKARLRLPNTQGKLNLVFTSDSNEDQTLEERVQGDASGQRIKKDQSLAGVEYVPEVTQTHWKQNWTTGVRVRMTPVFFTRYKIEKEWRLEDGWKSNFDQTFWYFNDDGLGATNQIDFSKFITPKDKLNLGTDIEYRDEELTTYYDFVVSNNHRLTKRSSIDYRAGVFGQNQPTNWVTSYLIGVRYRKVLYKDWLIFEVGPQVSYPRETGWRPVPSFTTELKVYFTE